MMNRVRHVIGGFSVVLLLTLSLMSFYKIIPFDVAVIGMLPPVFIAGSFLYASKGLKLQTKIFFVLVMRALTFLVAFALAGVHMHIIYDVLVVLFTVSLFLLFFMKHPWVKNSQVFKFLLNNLSYTFFFFFLGVLVSTILVTIYYYEFALIVRNLVESNLGVFFPFFVGFCFIGIIFVVLYAEFKIEYKVNNYIVIQKYQGGAECFYEYMLGNYGFMKIIFLKQKDFGHKNLANLDLTKYQDIGYNVIIFESSSIKSNVEELNNNEILKLQICPLLIFVDDSKKSADLDKRIIKYARGFLRSKSF